METIKVTIHPDGKTAKELNPFACYETRMPHPMDFDDEDEFQDRMSKWVDAEKKLKTYEIESATLTSEMTDVLNINHFHIYHIYQVESLNQKYLKTEN